MTQAGYRHRIIVHDVSGSMMNILAGAQQGYEEFVKGEEATPGKVTVSVWEFNTSHRLVYSFASPATAAEFKIYPHGGTNMYDAIAHAVNYEGQQLAALPEDERPEDVIVLIASDGEHNTTVQHTGPQVKEILDHQQDVYKWRVIYMGCNQDAFAESEKIGVSGGLTVNSVGTNQGMKMSWSGTRQYLDRVPVASAAVGPFADRYTVEERDLAEGRVPEVTEVTDLADVLTEDNN